MGHDDGWNVPSQKDLNKQTHLRWKDNPGNKMSKIMRQEKAWHGKGTGSGRSRKRVSGGVLGSELERRAGHRAVQSRPKRISPKGFEFLSI